MEHCVRYKIRRSAAFMVVAAGATAAFVGPRTALADELNADTIVPQVIAHSESPHAYDWRQASAELELALGEVQEANNFNTSTLEAAAGLPTGDGSLLRLGLRRSGVYSTPSSDDLGRTPFKQAAQQTRYEIFGGWAFGLLEGRAMTRFTPLLPDVENALFLYVGGHYSHPNESLIPRRSDTPRALPGQDPVNATFNLEAGLRLHVYLPQSFGLAFECLYNRPLGATAALHSWTYLDGGILWSFGAH